MLYIYKLIITDQTILSFQNITTKLQKFKLFKLQKIT